MLINTTILKDQRGICVTGYAASISAQSNIVGVENILLITTPPAYCGETIHDNLSKDLLHVTDPTKGDIWINETLESWSNKINDNSASINAKTRTYHYSVGVDLPNYITVPSGNTLSRPELKDVEINVIIIDSFPPNVENIPYTTPDPGNSNNGLLDFTNLSGLSDNSTIDITVTPI